MLQSWPSTSGNSRRKADTHLLARTCRPFDVLVDNDTEARVFERDKTLFLTFIEATGHVTGIYQHFLGYIYETYRAVVDVALNPRYDLL